LGILVARQKVAVELALAVVLAVANAKQSTKTSKVTCFSQIFLPARSIYRSLPLIRGGLANAHPEKCPNLMSGLSQMG